MKKLIGTAVVAALLATTAFAEGLSFGVWGRTLWSVGSAGAKEAAGGAVTDNTIGTWMQQSWGGNTPRIGLGIHGSSENIGFDVDFHANGDGINIGDNCLAWFKPVEMVKITLAAKCDQNTLRSDAAFGLWNFARIGVVGSDGEEGIIFPALLNKKGINVVATPIEGLTVGAGFDSVLGGAEIIKDSNTLVDQLGRTGSVAAAYKIANIGTVKVGFAGQGKHYDDKGGVDGSTKDRMLLAAAFEFTMLEKVYVAVGSQIPLGGTFGKYENLYNTGDLYVANEAPIKIAAYGRLKLIDNLTINVLGDVKLNAADKKKGDFKAAGCFGFRFGAEVEYGFSNGIGVFGEVQYANGIYMASNSGDNNDCLTFGLGATKGFSNGVVGIAFEGATNNKGRYPGKEASDFAWEVPIRFEYWF